MPNEVHPVVHYVNVFEDAGGEYRWSAFARNHKRVATSGEGYKSQKHAESIAERLFPGAHINVIIDIEPTAS